MKQTVNDFAQSHRFTAASASKIMRRAELDGRLTFTEDSEYKRTYRGSYETFNALAAQELQRLAKLRRAVKPAAEPTPEPQPVASPSRFAGGVNPWEGLGA